MILFPPIITIDGPTGVGKGALSEALSKKLKWNILDSGAIYRVLAMEVLTNKIIVNNINDKEKLLDIASKLDVVFINRSTGLNVLVKGKVMNDIIYNENIGGLASKIAVFPEVRRVLLKYQRSYYRFPGLIANGRDMGTVVFPNAVIKVFLDASYKVRCKRRMHQLKEKGIHVSFDHLLNKIKKRDNRDYTRKVAPLVPSNDSLILNSSRLSLSETVSEVLKYFYRCT